MSVCVSMRSILHILHISLFAALLNSSHVILLFQPFVKSIRFIDAHLYVLIDLCAREYYIDAWLANVNTLNTDLNRRDIENVDARCVHMMMMMIVIIIKVRWTRCVCNMLYWSVLLLFRRCELFSMFSFHNKCGVCVCVCVLGLLFVIHFHLNLFLDNIYYWISMSLPISFRTDAEC